jgi:hypothetical protein
VAIVTSSDRNFRYDPKAETEEEVMMRVIIFSLVVVALAAAPATLSKRFRTAAAFAPATEAGFAP